MPTRPFQRDDVLAVGEDDARDCDLVHRADGLADHGEGIVADLAIGDDVVWPHQVQLVDVGLRHEFVDVDGCAYRKSSPSILVMQSTQDRTAQNASRCLGGT